MAIVPYTPCETPFSLPFCWQFAGRVGDRPAGPGGEGAALAGRLVPEAIPVHFEGGTVPRSDLGIPVVSADNGGDECYQRRQNRDQLVHGLIVSLAITGEGGPDAHAILCIK